MTADGNSAICLLADTFGQEVRATIDIDGGEPSDRLRFERSWTRDSGDMVGRP